MGDPRKHRKKYTTPSHPWQRARIEEEKIIKKEFALHRKTEIWKMVSLGRSFAAQTKKLISQNDPQSLKERELLLAKLKKIGLLKSGSGIEEALSISSKDVLNRRLQTLVHKKGLARSVAQARQFITHGHITVAGKAVTSPAHIVTVEDEGFIGFSIRSSFSDPNHPERFIQESTLVVEEKKSAPVKEHAKSSEHKEVKAEHKIEHKEEKKEQTGEQKPAQKEQEKSEKKESKIRPKKVEKSA